MEPSPESFRRIAQEAQRNLNTYGTKTGAHKTSPSDEAGVDRRVENQFPGAEVKYGQDLSTNASYNKRIPPEEGGDLDARGRQTRGEHFEGVGGPEDKLGQQMRDFGGSNKFDSTNKRRHDTGARSVANEPGGAYSGEVMAEGREAVQSNIENSKYAPQKNRYPGAAYYEEPSGDMSAEGYEAPASVTEASRESARYQ